METKFSKEELEELKRLTAKFVFENTKLTVQRTGLTFDVQQVVNDVTVDTIKRLGQQINNRIKQKSDCEFITDDLDSTIKSEKEMEDLIEKKKFLLLLLKFKNDQNEKDKAKEELAELEKELKVLEDQNKTPQELMEEKKEKIKILKQKLD